MQKYCIFGKKNREGKYFMVSRKTILKTGLTENHSTFFNNKKHGFWKFVSVGLDSAISVWKSANRAINRSLPF